MNSTENKYGNEEEEFIKQLANKDELVSSQESDDDKLLPSQLGAKKENIMTAYARRGSMPTSGKTMPTSRSF